MSDVRTINPPSASLHLQCSQSYCRSKVTLQSLPINFPGLDKFLSFKCRRAALYWKIVTQFNTWVTPSVPHWCQQHNTTSHCPTLPWFQDRARCTRFLGMMAAWLLVLLQCLSILVEQLPLNLSVRCTSRKQSHFMSFFWKESFMLCFLLVG